MEKNRIRPIKSGRSSHMSYSHKRSTSDAESDRSPEGFLQMVSG